jgi:adenine phosphoribosyltransferase
MPAKVGVLSWWRAAWIGIVLNRRFIPRRRQQKRGSMNTERIRAAIRDIPDFPKPGILFKDITPILSDPATFRAVTAILAERCRVAGAIKVAAIDARGFFFAGAVCELLGIGLVPIRKKGKLPFKTFEESYDLEYGSATLAIHQDAFRRGEKVVLIDDLLATGGTAAAAARLIEKAGGNLVEIDFVIELEFLKGRAKLSGRTVSAIVKF